MARMVEISPVNHEEFRQEHRPFIQRNDLRSFTVSDGKNFMIFELTAADLETLLKGESRVILPRT